MQLNHLLYVSKAESEAFHIMLVACMHPVELIEDAPQIVFLDADTVVGDADAEVRLALIVGVNLNGNRLVLPTILEGIVQQVEDDVREVHLVGIDEWIVCLDLHVKSAAALRHLKGERIYHIPDDLVGIEFLHLKRYVVVLEETHLQDLLYLITQTTRLARNDASQSFVGCLALAHTLVRKHLSSN